MQTKPECKVAKDCQKTEECKSAADTLCDCIKGQCHVKGLFFWESNPGKL